MVGGIGVARLVVGAVLCWFLCLGNFCQCALLVTRLGLMPCSAWSKKKSLGAFLEVKCGKVNVARSTLESQNVQNTQFGSWDV